MTELFTQRVTHSFRLGCSSSIWPNGHVQCDAAWLVQSRRLHQIAENHMSYVLTVQKVTTEKILQLSCQYVSLPTCLTTKKKVSLGPNASVTRRDCLYIVQNDSGNEAISVSTLFLAQGRACPIPDNDYVLQSRCCSAPSTG